MKRNIYSNLLDINSSKRLSLHYMSLLNKINYETLRSKIKRDSSIDENLSYELVMNYNLTLKQLEEIKNARDYHKMIDYKYYWNIIYYVNKNEISKQVGLDQISAIFVNADGNYTYLEKDITFIPKYELIDYVKYSTSLILINKNKRLYNSKLDPVSASIEEEISIINSCLEKVNRYYGKDILKDIFYYKYILGINSIDIQKQLKLTKNRYYRLLNETNTIAYKAFGLFTDREIKRKLECISNI